MSFTDMDQCFSGWRWIASCNWLAPILVTDTPLPLIHLQFY
jgi:hypothetical protein